MSSELKEIKVHEHGFVKLLDVMGSDEEVENAARISYGEGTRKVSQTRNLLRYLMRHKHTSPFEMCEVKFHIKLPIFVMRQLVRHRTANLNEYSGRYSVMSDDFYFPKGKELKPQSTTNKQGREEGELRNPGEIEFELYRIFDGATTAYHNLLDWNVSRELARIVLPVSNYTEVIWKIDLHNFFKFYQLRGDSHAQQEIQDYADAMYHLVYPHFPICCEAFSDYVLNAVTFSEQEMYVIKELLEDADTKSAISQCMADYEGFNLGKRETEELLEKIKR
jgi:thymidylate synthase (FAD)